MLIPKKASFHTFLLIYVLLVLGANIAHPFTPQLFRVLEMPDYMFGLSFSLMAFTSFLFAPTWGSKSDSTGRIKIMCLCVAGYAFGQFLFSISTSMFFIVIARLISGTFSGGWNVMCISYVSDLSTDENKGRNMSIYVAVQSLATSIGFLCGGFIADTSIRNAFNLQVGILLLCAVLFGLLLKESDDFVPNKNSFKGFNNPLKSLGKAKGILTPALVVFFIIVCVSSFSTQALDNSFNYYVNAEYNLPPSFNGKVKATIGIVSLIANFTINMWLVKYTNWHKSLTVLFSMCSVSMILVMLAQNEPQLIIFCVSCFILNAIFLPLMQSILTTSQHRENSGVLAGLYHSSMYVGKVVGPLLAGILYPYGSKLPFLTVCIAYIGVTVLTLYNSKQFNCNK